MGVQNSKSIPTKSLIESGENVINFQLVSKNTMKRDCPFSVYRQRKIRFEDMVVVEGAKAASINQYGAGPRHPKTGHVDNFRNRRNFFPDFSHLFGDSDHFFRGPWVPLTFFPAATLVVYHIPIKIREKNNVLTQLSVTAHKKQWEAKFVWVMRGGLIRRRLFLESVRSANISTPFTVIHNYVQVREIFTKSLMELA